MPTGISGSTVHAPQKQLRYASFMLLIYFVIMRYLLLRKLQFDSARLTADTVKVRLAKKAPDPVGSAYTHPLSSTVNEHRGTLNPRVQADFTSLP